MGEGNGLIWRCLRALFPAFFGDGLEEERGMGIYHGALGYVYIYVYIYIVNIKSERERYIYPTRPAIQVKELAKSPGFQVMLVPAPVSAIAQP
jgi:hypothetical protein